MRTCLTWTGSVLPVVLILFAFNPTFAQQIQVSGQVTDSVSHAPLPLVHVYAPATAQGIVTDDEGKFLITMNRSDTLVFTSVGFKKYLFYVTGEENIDVYRITIEMIPATYELEPVRVTAYRDASALKQAVLSLNIPMEKKGFTLDIPSGYVVPSDGPTTHTKEPAVVIRGPVSALYNVFSKEAKEQKKLAAYRTEKHDQKIIESKYNPEVVKHLTDLSDEEVKAFMAWCIFEDTFILETSEYDLAIAVLACLDEFKNAPVDQEE